MATGWQGNTPGAPDLIVTAPKWGTLWVGLEVKRPGGAVRDAQKKLLNEGSICIVKSVRDALSQIIEIEKHFGNVTDRLEVVLNQLDRDNVHTKQ